ncbi:uncharacterized protein [Leptinotarsa decemlineata]|uniref:uncharacterized protein n=1 Tax=Leptinotarsa decemlineata TaxID=7539 RepID=UPI003D3087CA
MALVKIIPDRLNKEELEYEISIRGANPQGTVKELIAKLRQLIELENEGHSFKLTYNYEARNELDICAVKINEIKQALTENFTHSLVKKLRARLAHVLGRVENISSTISVEIEERSKLLSLTLECLDEFEKKHINFKDDLKKEENPVDVIFQTSLVQGGKQNTSTPVSVNNTDSQITSHQITDLTDGVSKVKIADWGLKFSGESDALGLNAFLERVNELRESRGLTNHQLFRSAVELFEGKALIYYRSLKSKINDWNTLCDVFREEFLPRDYNEKIWEQIKSRTQGDRESIAIYVAYMDNLFGRLTVTVEEIIKLKIIKKNILPFYQNQLAFVDIHSIEHLIQLCRRIEDNRKNMLEFTPPSSSKHTVEIDLSYQEEKSVKKKLDFMEFTKSVSFKKNKKPILKNHDKLSSDTECDTTAERERKPRNSSNDNINSGNYKDRDSSVDSRNSVGSSEGGNYRKIGRHESRSRTLNKHKHWVNSVNTGYEKTEDRVRNLSGNRDSYRGNFRDSSNDRRDSLENRNFGFVNRNSIDNRNYSGDRYRNFSGSRNFSGDRYRNSSGERNRDFSRDRYLSRRDRDSYGDNLNSDRYRVTNYNNYRPRGGYLQSNYQDNRNRDNQRKFSHNSEQQQNRNYSLGGRSGNQEIICFRCQGKNHIARYCTRRTENE